ncbi:metallophosphoesterase [Pseudomonas putida]|uniref:metallophosphoesterase n=1 Tax=Pseudomonas putida TaxID=303 RepID=UPI0037CB9BC1
MLKKPNHTNQNTSTKTIKKYKPGLDMKYTQKKIEKRLQPWSHTESQKTTFTPHVFAPVRFFRENKVGRDYVVGDIHGRYDLLTKLLSVASFNISKDRIFATGDLIDRGSFSHEALWWLDKLWFNSVRGNHEQMIIDVMAGTGDPKRHFRNGGEWFYETSKQQQYDIASALSELPIAFEIEKSKNSKVGVVHAEPPRWDTCCWEESLALLNAEHIDCKPARTQAIYSRTKLSELNTSTINGVERIYLGHTTVKEVITLGNTTYIDTGCSFEDGKLTMIDIKSEKIYSRS